MSYLLITQGTDGEREVSFADETAGRGAWLAVLHNPALAEARLERADVRPRDRVVCEWCQRGTFMDRTRAHLDELRDRAAELTARAPSGYQVDVEETKPGEWLVRFTGGGTPHSLGSASANTAGRLFAHWRHYVPSGEVITCDHVSNEGVSCSAAATETRRYSAGIWWDLCHAHAKDHDAATAQGRHPNYGLVCG